MPRKLYVHVGPTKTGTSALQSVLSEHDGSIVLYPKAGQHGPHRSHHGLVVAFFQRDRSAEARDLAEKLFGELAANVSGSKCDAVISSEWLMRRSPPEFIHHALSALGDDAWE